MSWASGRITTRIEDTAYCLLGMFNVNMPLLYGERHRAFRRLQEEIVKRKSDLSILAWTREPTSSDHSTSKAMNLFASSPNDFALTGDVVPFHDDFLDISVTNKGLFIKGDFELLVVQEIPYYSNEPVVTYELYLGSAGRKKELKGGVCLRKVGPQLFYRDPDFFLAGFRAQDSHVVRSLNTRDCYIVADPSSGINDIYIRFRRQALHIPYSATWTLKRVTPETLWDARDRIFLRPKLYSWVKIETVTATQVTYTIADHDIRLILLYDLRYNPRVKIFNIKDNSHEADVIFNPKTVQDGISWEDLKAKLPTVLKFTDSVPVTVGEKRWKISASIEASTFQHNSTPIELFSLQLVAKEIPTREKQSQ